MEILIIRHGIATHLLEDYNNKISYEEFCTSIESWKGASLTERGMLSIQAIAKTISDDYNYLYYSPLLRTEQTTALIIKNIYVSNVLPLSNLSEIFTFPPKFTKIFTFSIKFWISLCVVKSIYTLSILKYIKEARKIFNTVSANNCNTIIVSHQARILTMLIYCLFSLKWRIKKINVDPAGISIIEKR